MHALTVATVTDTRATFVAMATAKKSRNGKIERDARVRLLLEEPKEKRFGGGTAALARALGFTGPAITEILQEKRGVGLDLLIALADLTGQTIDQLVGRPTRDRPTLASLPQWGKARLEAERRLAHLRPEVVAAAIDRVGAFGVPETPVVLTGLFVARLAEAVAMSPSDF